MNRVLLLGAAAACIACAVAASCRVIKAQKPPSVAVDEYPPFRGADHVEASPSGAFLAAEFRFIGGDVLPLVEVIERSSGRVIATARGSLLGAPDERGEAFYLSPDAAMHPTVRSTLRANFSVTLQGPFDPFWSGHRAGDRLMVVVHPVGDGAVDLSSVDVAKAAVEKTRDLGGDPRTFRFVASAALATAPVLYLSFQTPTSPEGEQAGPASGYLAALDAVTLHEKWRSPWKAGAELFLDQPALAVSGDGRYLVARASNAIQIVATGDGQSVGVVPFSGLSSARFRSFPGRSAVLAMESTTGPMAAYERRMEIIELPSGSPRLLWSLPRADSPSPTDFSVVDGRVFLAVQASQPRLGNDKSTWGPEILSYVR